MFVTDDVPFLVDSVRMVLDRYRLGIHLLDPPDALRRPQRPSRTRRRRSARRSGRGLDADRARPMPVRPAGDSSKPMCASAIDDVQSVVRDFAPMQERLCRGRRRRPVAALARRRELRVPRFGDLRAFALRDCGRSRDSLLGRVPDPSVSMPSASTRPAQEGDESVVIARTDAVATVHRRARMTSIAVRPPGDRAGGPIRRSARQRRLPPERVRHPGNR